MFRDVASGTGTRKDATRSRCTEKLGKLTLTAQVHSLPGPPISRVSHIASWTSILKILPCDTVKFRPGSLGNWQTIGISISNYWCNWILPPQKSELPRWLRDKESTCSARDTGSIPGTGRSPGGGHGNPLQNSCLENPMDSGAWQATVHGAAKSRTRLKRLSTHARTHTHTHILRRTP